MKEDISPVNRERLSSPEFRIEPVRNVIGAFEEAFLDSQSARKDLRDKIGKYKRE